MEQIEKQKKLYLRRKNNSILPKQYSDLLKKYGREFDGTPFPEGEFEERMEIFKEHDIKTKEDELEKYREYVSLWQFQERKILQFEEAGVAKYERDLELLPYDSRESFIDNTITMLEEKIFLYAKLIGKPNVKLFASADKHSKKEYVCGHCDKTVLSTSLKRHLTSKEHRFKTKTHHIFFPTAKTEDDDIEMKEDGVTFYIPRSRLAEVGIIAKEANKSKEHFQEQIRKLTAQTICEKLDIEYRKRGIRKAFDKYRQKLEAKTEEEQWECFKNKMEAMDSAKPE